MLYGGRLRQANRMWGKAQDGGAAIVVVVGLGLEFSIGPVGFVVTGRERDALKSQTMYML